jgi:hypothetical protein
MIKKFFKLFFSFIALFVTIGVPIVAVHDAIHPWPVAAKSLDQERQNFFIFAVGVAATGSTITQRSYALIPKGFHAPTIMFVDQAADGHLKAEKQQFAFWLLSGFFLYGIYVLNQIKHWVAARWKWSPPVNAR